MPDYEALGYALGAMAGVLVVVALIALALAIFMVVCNVFIYKKMGAPGWAAIVPFYNTWVLYDMVWSTMPWFWVNIGNFIVSQVVSKLSSSSDFFLWGILSFLCTILSLGLMIAQNIKLAKAFGQSAGFTVGLCLLPVVFLPMLAFGSAEYQGNPG